MIGVNRARGIVPARIVVGSLLLVAVVSWGSLSFAAPQAQGRAAQQKKLETADQEAARRLRLRGQSELEQGHADLALSSLNAAKHLENSFAVEGALADATVALVKPTAAARACSNRFITIHPVWTSFRERNFGLGPRSGSSGVIECSLRARRR